MLFTCWNSASLARRPSHRVFLCGQCGWLYSRIGIRTDSRTELRYGPRLPPVVDQSSQASAYSGCQLVENLCARLPTDPHLTQQPRQVQPTLVLSLCRLAYPQPRSQPAPQCWRQQQLRPPPPKASPLVCLTAASEADADRARGLPQNQMPVERFNDDCCRIPPPRMQPIRQSAHRVAAIPAQVSPHPNDNPPLTQAADLTAVATMPLHPHAPTITRQLPALCTASRPKLFNRWRPRTSRTQVLDGNSEAV